MTRPPVMTLLDIFRTSTMLRTLDFLLANPETSYYQGDLTRRLNVDKATMRRTIARLHLLGLVDVDVDPAGVRIKSVKLNRDSETSRALLVLHESRSRIQNVSQNYAEIAAVDTA